MFESTFNDMINGDTILEKHRSLLKTISDDKTMMISHYENEGYAITECCDEWYYHELTKEECLELSELFKEIAEVIEEVIK